jgi:hypothetical protein
MKMLPIFLAFLGYGFVYWGIGMVRGQPHGLMYDLFKLGG